MAPTGKRPIHNGHAGTLEDPGSRFRRDAGPATRPSERLLGRLPKCPGRCPKAALRTARRANHGGMTQQTEAPPPTDTSPGTHAPHPTNGAAPNAANPWPALWALCLGFFVILVDATIVSVATPAIQRAFDADINSAVWVTSAYLLAYAVPLLITERLGDRVGPKQIYLVGLATFTVASLWCALTGSIGGLIAARVVQGLGAALMTPQTMAVITRIFPANARGKAMGMWGAVGGIASLVGPVLGGLLVDHMGWEWIFLINIPVGVIGLVLAARLVPRLPTHARRFDWVGVVLSAIGMFALVFGIQEGPAHGWGALRGWLTIPMTIGAGLFVLLAFVLWQARGPAEPLLPLGLFRDRNFSLANVAIAAVLFGVTAMLFPLMFWAQAVRGWSPTRAALLLVPMAVIAIGLAPVAGSLVDRHHPRWLAAIGLGSFVISLVWLRQAMRPDTSVPYLLLPLTAMGISHGFMWSPISTTATRNLPLRAAGAGSGVYNTIRQVGAVLGSAAIAVAMENRLDAYLGSAGTSPSIGSTAGRMSPPVADAFSNAMADAMLVPAAVLLVGLLAVCLFERPGHVPGGPGR